MIVTGANNMWFSKTYISIVTLKINHQNINSTFVIVYKSLSLGDEEVLVPSLYKIAKNKK